MLYRSNVTEKKYYSFSTTPTKCVVEVNFYQMGCYILWFRQNLGFLPPEYGLTLWVNGYPAKVWSSSLGLRPFTETVDVLGYVSSGVNDFQVELWSSLPSGLPRYVFMTIVLDADVDVTLQRVEYPPTPVWDISGFLRDLSKLIMDIVLLMVVFQVLPLIISFIKDVFKKD